MVISVREPVGDAELVSPVRPPWLPKAALAAGWLTLASGCADLVVNGMDGAALWFVASAVLMAASMLVLRRRPALRLGGWFAVMTGLLAVGFVLPSLLRWGTEANLAEPRVFALALGYVVVNVVTTVAAMRVMVLFPDGRFLDRVDRTVLRATWLLLFLPLVLLLFAPQLPLPDFIGAGPVANPIEAPWAPIGLSEVEALLGGLNLVGAVGAGLLLRRYRRVDVSLRRSIRWLLLPAIVGTAFAVLALLLGASEEVLGVGMLVFVVALGAAITLGLLRPAGIDVDETLRRSVVYGVLVVSVAGLYAATSALLGLTVGGDLSVEWAVLLTVVAMLSLQPLRAWLERWTRRWLFGTPPDPRRVVLGLGDWLEDTYDVETLLHQMAAALEEGLGVEWARVSVVPDPCDAPTPAALAVPIELDGEQVGLIECGRKRSGSLDAEDEAIVEALAGQAALAVRNARLNALVEERNAELAASRARLVRAQEDERRRIERNIHDGVQQDLVALIGSAGLARRRLTRSDHDASPELVNEIDELRVGLQRVLSELRDLAAGIHPSLLRDRGLLVAIEGLAARHPLPVTISAEPELRNVRLPGETEGAGYYAVAESLANCLKHAEAETMSIDLARSNGTLTIRVSDDGCGFDGPQPPGRGLANLAERIDALGGELRVISRPGAGTTVLVDLALERTDQPS